MRRLAVAVAVVAAAALAACSSNGGSTATTASSSNTTTSANSEGARIELSPLEGRPAAAVVSTGVLWVADDGRGVVTRLDHRSGRALGPPIAVSPHPIAIDAGATTVWVADRDGTITRIDAATGEIVGAPIAVGGQVVDLLVEGQVAWVADIESSTLHQIDVPTGARLQSVLVPNGVVRLASGPTGIWVTNVDQTVSLLDRTTLAVHGPYPVGPGPIGIAVAGAVVWVANSDDGTVSRLDATDGHTLAAPINVGGTPVAIVIDGGVVWVVQQDAQSVTELDAATGAPKDSPTNLGVRPRDATIALDGLWVVGIDPSAAVLVKKRSA